MTNQYPGNAAQLLQLAVLPRQLRGGMQVGMVGPYRKKKPRWHRVRLGNAQVWKELPSTDCSRELQIEVLLCKGICMLDVFLWACGVCCHVQGWVAGA